MRGAHLERRRGTHVASRWCHTVTSHRRSSFLLSTSIPLPLLHPRSSNFSSHFLGLSFRHLFILFNFFADQPSYHLGSTTLGPLALPLLNLRTMAIQLGKSQTNSSGGALGDSIPASTAVDRLEQRVKTAQVSVKVPYGSTHLAPQGLSFILRRVQNTPFIP